MSLLELFGFFGKKTPERIKYHVPEPEVRFNSSPACRRCELLNRSGLGGFISCRAPLFPEEERGRGIRQRVFSISDVLLESDDVAEFLNSVLEETNRKCPNRFVSREIDPN